MRIQPILTISSTLLSMVLCSEHAQYHFLLPRVPSALVKSLRGNLVIQSETRDDSDRVG